MSARPLICFAVREEAKFFIPPPARALVTGMGRRNALHGIQTAFAKERPSMVLTCGFAGGLNPRFERGEILFEEDAQLGLGDKAVAAGAKRASFLCAERVAVTAAEKRKLWQATGKDAVEMESEVIRAYCAEQGIPSGTFRVISDAAHEDLPLDFNVLMNAEQKLDFKKLGFTLLRAPRKIGELLSFQQKTIDAARNLARFLNAIHPWKEA